VRSTRVLAGVQVGLVAVALVVLAYGLGLGLHGHPPALVQLVGTAAAVGAGTLLGEVHTRVRRS